jgi:hypothetical protein
VGASVPLATEATPAATAATPAAGAAPHAAAAVTPPEPQPAGQTLRFRAQPGWVEQAPSNSMRKAQYELPAAAGDSAAATLVVFYFQGGGGSFDANVERWCSQMQQPDGGNARDKARVWTEALGEFAVQRFDLSGTYSAETPPGSGNFLNNPDWRLATLTVTAPEGPYQIRVVGPRKTVEKWLPSVETFKQQLLP